VKLEHVEITGFGRLSGVELPLHPRVSVVFGNNESGKSTLQRAVRAALYGLDAGGQGRAVDKSDWSRWKPWSGDRYRVALTYALDDGRRMRLARRLDTREQSVQVVELGGRDVTAQERIRGENGIDQPVEDAERDEGVRVRSSRDREDLRWHLLCGWAGRAEPTIVRKQFWERRRPRFPGSTV